MNKFAELDHRYVWHPFTQMKTWLEREPIVISSGQGAVLRDVHGHEYLDANSSIWTNLHGHAHPKLNAALNRQLKRIAHSSFLGLANEPASVLAAKLVQVANRSKAECGMRNAESERSRTRRFLPHSALRTPHLAKVFFSDDGSTAMEVALKLAYEFARRTGRSRRPKFLSLAGAYHGDTVGAVSLGHIDLFHKAYARLLFKSDQVPAPYCYRCPHNRAKPERADARLYRKCNWECTRIVEETISAQRKKGNPYAAMVVEPLIQGAAGMIPQPPGWLRRIAEIVRQNGAQLIADEVMTGFGRVGQASSLPNENESESDNLAKNPSNIIGQASSPKAACPTLFACQHEGVQPDFLVLAKGLTGGYLPMAATLTTQTVFDSFLGEYSEFKTFFHGHSYTGNQLGAAAALASLELLQSPKSMGARRHLEATLRRELPSLWDLPNVGDIRQVGLIAGVELVRDWPTRTPFDLHEGTGQRVCAAMAGRGVLTRSIGDVIVLMPPYCTTAKQAKRIVSVLYEAIAETCAPQRGKRP
ncbi:MAG: aminotransferase class III-fold pyridoxal phosphate-dependent enzyme [Verrucomicrobiales bacterium]|nr:aminotransferase class III-fold pyridoxal phosphate-dependent enzyme [Verrucomicrobiales bacterium]